MDGIKRGDVVELKSGSPKMTVGNVSDSLECSCQWFDYNNLVSGIFNIDSLKLSEK